MGFEDTWSEATTENNFDDTAPPDGEHDVALMDAGAFTSKSGNDVVKLEFQTVDKAYSWALIGGFKTTQAAGFTKAACEKVGVNVDQVGSLDELDQALKQHVGAFYEVTVKRNGDFTNTYVNDGASAPTPDVPADTANLQPAAAGGAADQDEIPF